MFFTVLFLVQLALGMNSGCVWEKPVITYAIHNETLDPTGMNLTEIREMLEAWQNEVHVQFQEDPTSPDILITTDPLANETHVRQGQLFLPSPVPPSPRFPVELLPGRYKDLWSFQARYRNFSLPPFDAEYWQDVYCLSIDILHHLQSCLFHPHNLSEEQTSLSRACALRGLMPVLKEEKESPQEIYTLTKQKGTLKPWQKVKGILMLEMKFVILFHSARNLTLYTLETYFPLPRKPSHIMGINLLDHHLVIATYRGEEFFYTWREACHLVTDPSHIRLLCHGYEPPENRGEVYHTFLSVILSLIAVVCIIYLLAVVLPFKYRLHVT